MAPVSLNIYLAAANFLFAQRNWNAHNIHLTYRLDGSLFHLDRLKAYTKVKHERVPELKYADDCALVAYSPEDLQHSISLIHSIYSDLRLATNPVKTEVLV